MNLPRVDEIGINGDGINAVSESMETTPLGNLNKILNGIDDRCGNLVVVIR